ncbi:hypothetical protein PG5_17700 [Pseudomonas sp. G5(2012)]|jgi:hypothetical protein|nr:hypothetical protein PG5_17700 [Pseudomonas sp. G5(2012)]
MSALRIQDLNPGYLASPRHCRFFGRALFSRAASFSDVGMFPWQ